MTSFSPVYALKESVEKGKEIRLIRGLTNPSNWKKKIYIYDRIYLVSKFWEEKGKSGFKEFKFELKRKPD